MPQKQQKRHKDDAVSVLEVLAAKQQKETEDAEDERVDPLFPAMLSGLSPGGMDLAEVRRLLEAGADVEVVNEGFGTPLVYACSQCTMHGHFKPQYEALVRLLLSFGADANRPVWQGHARGLPQWCDCVCHAGDHTSVLPQSLWGRASACVCNDSAIFRARRHVE